MIAALLLLPGLLFAPTGGGTDELAALLEAARALPIPPLEEVDIGRWRDHLRPSPNEIEWEAIPWLPTFAAGVHQADAAGRPLLFWAMNGHPLGCT